MIQCPICKEYPKKRSFSSGQYKFLCDKKCLPIDWCHKSDVNDAINEWNIHALYFVNLLKNVKRFKNIRSNKMIRQKRKKR